MSFYCFLFIIYLKISFSLRFLTPPLQVYLCAKKLKHHWTFLNVMRHLLLIPNDEVNGRKMWNLVEIICNQVILAEASETTKLKFAEWLPMYNTKDKHTKVHIFYRSYLEIRR